jgi:multicomponent Na+:H+ antiporter subunit D
MAVVGVWMLVVPAGTHLDTTFFVFQVVLFDVDPVSRFMGTTFALIATVTIVYAYASERSISQTALGIAYAGTGLGAVFAGDWLTLLVFWELMTVGSLLLIWSSRGPAVRAGFRYAVFHGIGGVLLILAVGMQYVAVGSFLFSAHDGIVAGVPAALAAVGIGVNAGFVAVHTWLPDAYPKSHFVVSVILCGYTTKTAVYALFRAFPDGHLLVAYMGGAMAIFGVTYALLQTDMRRLLSYHIQSQVGYMVAGIGLGSALGVGGSFFHLFNNVVYKTLLFMIAGVIIYRTGQNNLKKLGGLARVMPVTFVVFLIAALSIVGLPGFNGYVSKTVVKSAAQKEQLTALTWIFTVAGVGTAMSFAKFGYYAFFHGEASHDVSDATHGQSVAMGFLAVLCLLFGLFPATSFGLLPSLESATTPYTVDKAGQATVLAGVGLVAFYLLKTPLSKLTHVPDLDGLYGRIGFDGTAGIVSVSATVARSLDAAGTGVASAVTTTVTQPPERLKRLVDRIKESMTGRPTGDITVAILTIILLTGVLLFVL